MKPAGLSLFFRCQRARVQMQNGSSEGYMCAALVLPTLLRGTSSERHEANGLFM